jgi:hypothetical protein
VEGRERVEERRTETVKGMQKKLPMVKRRF